jgi:hypothetical protein
MSVEFVQQAIELRALSGALVRTLLPFGECVDAVQQAVRGVSAGNVLMPLRRFMPLTGGWAQRVES